MVPHSHRLLKLINQPIIVLTDLTSVQNRRRSRNRVTDRRIMSEKKKSELIIWSWFGFRFVAK